MITSQFSGQVLSGRGTVREVQATYLGGYQGRKIVAISNHKVYFAVTVRRKQRVQAVKSGKTDHYPWQGQRRGQDQLEDLGEGGDDQRGSQEVLNHHYHQRRQDGRRIRRGRDRRHHRQHLEQQEGRTNQGHKVSFFMILG